MESYALLIAATLNAGTVLAIASLGLLINEKAGIVNLGAEGIMLCAAIAGFAAVVHTGSDLMGFAAGIGAGALLAGLFGLLVIWLNTNQYATGLALSLFGAGFSAFAGIAYVQEKMPEHMLLNVNIPKALPQTFKGMKICRQAYAKWAEEFEHRVDPRGKDYYWMTGKFINMDKGSETDVQALKDGYASVVPIKFDFTDTHMKSWLETEWKDLLS